MASYNPFYQSYSQPINMPRKYGQQQQAHPQQTINYPLVGSPPEAAASQSSGPTFDPTATSSSYAGSASDYESAQSANGVDLMDYMHGRVQGSFDPTRLDRSLARQAQTSGELNAKTRQIRELQALARSRLSSSRSQFADGMKAAKEVQRDLEWTQKRVSAINQRAQRKYPVEHAMASQRYPAPVDM